MESKTFVASFPKQPGKLVFKFTQRGAVWFLAWYECQAELSDVQCRWMAKWMPTLLEDIETLKAQAKGTITITEMTSDLTFETFYTKYNDKLGKKKTASAMWDTFNESQRIAIHEHHDKEYLPYLAQPQNRFMAKKHINTYFNWLKENGVI